MLHVEWNFLSTSIKVIHVAHILSSFINFIYAQYTSIFSSISFADSFRLSLPLVLSTRNRGVQIVMQFFFQSRQLPAAILLSRKRLLESQFSGLSPLLVLDQRKVGLILFWAKSGDRGYDFRKARKTCSRSTVARERSYDTRRVARAAAATAAEM